VCGLPVVTLAKTTSFIILVVFALINLALVRIKRRTPRPDGIRTYPMWVPVAGLLSTTGFVLFQIAGWLRG
jgi:amino acid transporter